jgi:Protein of unknown function (DUF2924)
MPNRIENRLLLLPKMGKAQLLELWKQLYGKAVAPKLRRELMVPFLAYRMQELQYGGLKPSTRAELRRIARGLERSSASELTVRPRIKAGARLFRRWKGDMHEIFATESSYEYRGVGYRSLSEVARKITGTRWSGPAFFGLKKASSDLVHSDD